MILLANAHIQVSNVNVSTGFLGTATGNGTHVPFKLKKSVPLKAGENNIDLLSMTVGLSVIL